MIRIREKRMIKVMDMVPSPARNVRGNRERTGIPALAELIYTQGLLHAPTVVAAKVGKGKRARTVYETDAGERRRLAMVLLIEQGRWPADTEIEANVAELDEGTELSLSENLGSDPMHPVDAYLAFRRLIETEGKNAADIAAHFGISELTVRRYLRLANIAPSLLEAYRSGEIHADQIAALSVTEDHEAQVRVWETAASWERSAPDLRAALTAGELSTVHDAVATWVGVAAIEAAGGAVRRDLFSEDGEAFVADRELLDRLAAERLQAIADAVRSEGWGWVEVKVRMHPSTMGELGRCPQVRREPSAAEADRIAALEARIAELEAGAQDLYDQEDDADVDSGKLLAMERESACCGDELKTLQASLLEWNEDVIAHAGALVSITRSRTGEPVPVVHRGLVTPEHRDALNVAAEAAGLERVADATGPGRHQNMLAKGSSARPRPEYSEPLMRRLTAHRTAALQAVIAASPQVATALLVERLLPAQWTGYQGRRDALKISATDAAPGLERDADDVAASKAWAALGERKAAWEGRFAGVPRERVLPTLLALPLLDLHELLALCVAATINGVQGRPGAHDVDGIAEAVGLDMADWWEPSAGGFLSHVPKAKLIEAVTEAVSAEAAKPLQGMKKPEAVAAAERLLEGTRWIPHPLRSEPFALTNDGADDVEMGERNVEAEASAQGQAQAQGEEVSSEA